MPPGKAAGIPLRATGDLDPVVVAVHGRGSRGRNGTGVRSNVVDAGIGVPVECCGGPWGAVGRDVPSSGRARRAVDRGLPPASSAPIGAASTRPVMSKSTLTGRKRHCRICPDRERLVSPYGKHLSGGKGSTIRGCWIGGMNNLRGGWRVIAGAICKPYVLP